MILGDWIEGAVEASLPPLSPSPVPLVTHQERGARRILSLLEEFGGALLADAPGLGKSFTAAAVARDLSARSFRIEVLAPVSLLDQWRGTLARFGVAATLISHDDPGGVEVISNRLIIVDEAHRFTNRATHRWQRLSTRCGGAKVLLITATPLCNRIEDLRSLLALFLRDDALVPWGMASVAETFDEKSADRIRSALAIVSVRRTEIEGLQFPMLARSLVRFALDPVLSALIEELMFPIVSGNGQVALMREFLFRRLESSLEALDDSLIRQERFYRRAREKRSRGFEFTRADFSLLFASEEGDYFQDLLFPEAFLSPANSPGDLSALDQELQRVRELRAKVRESGSAKFELLLETLRGVDLPALIFTRAVATAEALHRGVSSVWSAGLATSSRALDATRLRRTFTEVVSLFRRRRLDLLIVTDLAAEGLDLQAAGTIIHYDLPWTAVRVDQRNGRSRRLAQPRELIHAVYFVPAGPSNASPVRFVSRKRRLERRFLPSDLAAGCMPVRMIGSRFGCRVGAAHIVVEGGHPVIMEDDTASADPARFRKLIDRPIETGDAALEKWDRWRAEWSIIPQRRRSSGVLVGHPTGRTERGANRNADRRSTRS
ncbi:MAG TPA: DEAD/DEAH box helicase [Thermoanaerobaculia bacterium]|nr:DEAD/DEAH box helicase [Thermoanaerobaculia bacterium]